MTARQWFILSTPLWLVIALIALLYTLARELWRLA